MCVTIRSGSAIWRTVSPLCPFCPPLAKSQVSRLCEEINGRVTDFLDRPLERDWPYVSLDATYVKVRRNHRIVSVAVIVAVGGQCGWAARGAGNGRS